MDMKNYLCHTVLMFLLMFGPGRGELYTALVDLEGLLETEAVLIEVLDNYIKAEEEKIGLLKRFADVYKTHHGMASEDVETYVANPINAYTLVKRLTTDWNQVETLMSVDIGEDFRSNITEIKHSMAFPTDEDLSGAATALTRLQDTYRLDTGSLARGELRGVKYSAQLTAADCFELGRQAYNQEDYHHTLLWMDEAKRRVEIEAANETTVEMGDVLEYLAFATFKEGDMRLALDLTNKLLDLAPDHPRAVGNKQYYQDQLEKNKDPMKKGDDESEEILEDEPVIRSDPDKERYEALCRGEIMPPIELMSELHCRYVDHGDPYLKIAPFRMEQVYRDPDIFIYYNVISDEEIATVKHLAHPRFRRATVQNSVTGELEVATYRISKSAWLKEHEHPHVATVVQRVQDFTRLVMDTAEELQVVNYGIGGHYEPHFDFARRDETNAFKSLGTGNRIATVLFYMSDVAQGGATVFTQLEIALWPKKGSAAFWYNLHPSGEGDTLTRHAACPVLAGSKWVSNKWIHERGQEFLRPCTNQLPPEDRVA